MLHDDEDRLALIEIEDKVLIEIKGNIDLYTTPELKDAFDQLNKTDKDKIIIDLLNVNFIDSSGLGILVTQALFLQKKNLVLKFINVNSTINHVFSLGGFTRSFKKCNNKEEALNSKWEFGI